MYLIFEFNDLQTSLKKNFLQIYAKIMPKLIS